RPPRPPPPPPPRFDCSRATQSPLELEAALTGAFCECLHPAMVEIPAPVEDHLGDSLLLGALRQHLAGELATIALRKLVRAADVRRPGRDAENRHALHVVDDLS